MKMKRSLNSPFWKIKQCKKLQLLNWFWCSEQSNLPFFCIQSRTSFPNFAFSIFATSSFSASDVKTMCRINLVEKALQRDQVHTIKALAHRKHLSVPVDECITLLWSCRGWHYGKLQQSTTKISVDFCFLGAAASEGRHNDEIVGDKVRRSTSDSVHILKIDIKENWLSFVWAWLTW